MIDPVLVNVLTGLGGVFAAGIAWLLADTRSKSRIGFMEEKLGLVTGELEKMSIDSQKRIGMLELSNAKNEQAHIETNNNITRLDSTKASKEIVEGFRNEIQTLKTDMDKRFDRIERLLEKKEF